MPSPVASLESLLVPLASASAAKNVRRSKGCRIVIDTTFDASPEAIAAVFAPRPVPPGVAPGAILIDALSGDSAVVVGVARSRGTPALFMLFDGHEGATPFCADETFSARWATQKYKLLPAGHPFRLPDLSNALRDRLKAEKRWTTQLHATPLNVTVLDALGIQHSTMLNVHDPEGKRSCRVIGLKLEANGNVGLLTKVSTKGVLPEAPASEEPSVAGSASAAVKHAQGPKLRTLHGGEIVEVVSHREITALQTSFSVKRSHNAAAAVTFEADPKMEDPLHKLHLSMPLPSREEIVELMMVDPDPERTKHYFEVKPRDIITGGLLVVGVTAIWGAYQRGESKEVFLAVTKADEALKVFRLPPFTQYSVTGFTREAPRYRGPIPRSLSRAIPKDEGLKFEIPAISQDMNDYRFTFPYLHRSTQRFRKYDTEFMLRDGSPQRLELGQRCYCDSGQWSTFIGVAMDNDGKIELMFEVDGVVGAGAYAHSTTLTAYSEVVPVKPVTGKGWLYSRSEERKDIPVQPCAYAYLGEVCPRLEPVDNDPFRMELYFGVRAGQRLSGYFTVVGMQKVDDKVVLFFRPDGRVGATSFKQEKDEDAFHFMKLDEEDIADDSLFVKAKPLRGTGYKKANADRRYPFTPSHSYSFGGEMTFVEQVDTDPKRCEFYFGVTPGTRLCGAHICLGTAKEQGGKLALVAYCDGKDYAQKYTEEGNEVVVEEGAVPGPISLQPVDDTRRAITYNRPSLRPGINLIRDFPVLSGLQVDKELVMLLDVDPKRIKELFPDIAPGERFGGRFTAVGMAPDSEEKHIEMFFSVDGQEGLGTFTDGTILVRDGEVRPYPPLALDTPLPTGTMTKYVVPTVQTDPTFYNFTFPHVTRSNSQRLMLDTEFMLKCHPDQLASGTRFQITKQGGYCTFFGVGIEGPKGAPCLWFKIDRTPGLGMWRPGTDLLRSEMIVPIEPFGSSTYVYEPKKLDKRIHVMEQTYCRTTNSKGEVQSVLVDTNRKRALEAFALQPGQRVDDRLTVVGTRADGKGNVILLFFEREGRHLTTAGARSTLEIRPFSGPPASAERPNCPLQPNEPSPRPSRSLSFRRLEDGAFLHAVDRVALTTAVGGKDGLHARLDEKLTRYTQGALTLEQLTSYVVEQAPVFLRFDPFVLVGDRAAIELMTEEQTLRAVSSPKADQLRAAFISVAFKPIVSTDIELPPALQGTALSEVPFGAINLLNEPRFAQLGDHAVGDCFLAFSDAVRTSSILFIRKHVDSAASVTRANPTLFASPNNSTLSAADSLLRLLDDLSTSQFRQLCKVASGVRSHYDRSAAPFAIHALMLAPATFGSAVTHLVLDPKYRSRAADLALSLDFARTHGCWVITTATTAKLATLRCASKDELDRFVTENDLSELVNAWGTSLCVKAPCTRLVAGPPSKALRPLFDAITDALCAKEMAELVDIVRKGKPQIWNPPHLVPSSVGVKDLDKLVDLSDDEIDESATDVREVRSPIETSGGEPTSDTEVEEIPRGEPPARGRPGPDDAQAAALAAALQSALASAGANGEVGCKQQ